MPEDRVTAVGAPRTMSTDVGADHARAGRDRHATPGCGHPRALYLDPLARAVRGRPPARWVSSDDGFARLSHAQWCRRARPRRAIVRARRAGMGAPPARVSLRWCVVLGR